jgi:hypothetical protein
MCVVLTSVNEPEVTQEPRRVTGPPIGVELEDEARPRAVEHVRYVCEPPAEEPWPWSVFVHFGTVQMKEQFQEVTTLTAETQRREQAIFICEFRMLTEYPAFDTGQGHTVLCFRCGSQMTQVSERVRDRGATTR